MSIQNELDKIKNSVYGREVRGGIHDGIKKAYDDASEKGNANMEVKMARGSYNTLNERLYSADLENDLIRSNLGKKADKEDLAKTNADIDNFNQRVDKIIATPTTVSKEEIIDARDDKGSLGANIREIKNNLTEIKEVNKVDGMDIHKEIPSSLGGKITSKNLFNLDTVLTNKRLIRSNGLIVDYDSYSTSTFIEVEEGETYYSNVPFNAAYDKNFNYIESFEQDKPYFIKPNVNYVRIGGGSVHVYNYRFSKDEPLVGSADHEYTIKSLGVNKKFKDEIKNMHFKIIDTIGTVRFNMAGNTLEVIILGGSKGSQASHLYGYVDDELIASVIIDATAKYSLEHYQSLVWVWDSNNIKVVNEKDSLDGRYIELVTYSRNGLSINGYLVDRKSIDEYSVNNTQVNNVVTASNLYVESLPEKSRSYFKFDSITILKGYKSKTYTWDQFKKDFAEYYFRTSDNWIKDSFYLEENRKVSYDFLEEKFRVNTLGNNQNKDHVELIYHVNSVVRGSLAEQYTQDKMREIGVRKNEINKEYLSEISKKENEVIRLLNENTFSVAFSTDHHPQEWAGGHINMTSTVLNKVGRRLNVDAIINGGDSIAYGRHDKDIGLNDLKHMMDKIDDKEKHYHIIGNHDYNSSSYEETEGKQRRSWVVEPYETYSVLGMYQKENVVWGSKEKMYYYKDDKDKKIRMIFLNTSDNDWVWINDNDGKEDYLKVDPMSNCGILQKQAEWLADIALDVDSNDWHVMIFAHIPLYRSEDGMRWSGPVVENDQAIREIIKGFMVGGSGKADYTDYKYSGLFDLDVDYNFSGEGAGNLIGIFSGHTHVDNLVEKEGIYNLTTTAGYPDQTIIKLDPSYQRIPNTYSEFAFDTILVDKEKRKVVLKRFGFGEDREYNY